MVVEIGIIGLAQSGRTTIFNALTSGKGSTGGYIQAGFHIGMAKVPEPRFKALADMLNPKKITPAEVTYVDVGTSITDLAKEKTSSGQLLTQLRKADTLINVVRAFADESIPHIEGSLDIDRDISAMNLELAFADLALLEKRLERIETSLKAAKPTERQNLLHEQEILKKLKSHLEKETAIRELGLTIEEARITANYQFLTAKPLLVVVNIGEDQVPQATSLEAELASRHSRPNCRLITLCGKLEMELAQLDDTAAVELRAEFGIEKSGLDSVIKQSYELLGLVTFVTIASCEIRAWSIKSGTNAVTAAGKIHSDMERGFIRAEVIGYDDLIKCSNLAEARKKGMVRLEGKTYLVQDGDVITFLFNI
jgi:GTP-binding protein YchF